VQLKLAPRQGVAYSALESLLRLEMVIHAGIIKAEDISAVGLGSVKGNVCILEHPIRAFAIIGGDTDADAGRDGQPVTPHVIGSCNSLH
jgi:hypothetical protein